MDSNIPAIDSAKSIEKAIIDIIAASETPTTPSKLFRKLREKDFTEGQIREGIWQLLDQQQLSLTDDLELAINNPKHIPNYA